MKPLMLIFAVLILSWGCHTPQPPQPKMLLIGLDAASLDVIESLVEAGKLPTFKRLMAEGTYGPLGTFEPTESPQIWTTIATGKPPTEHGINSFTRRIPGTDTTVPLHSSYRTAPAFWNIFSLLDRSVIVIKWWASWPAEKIKGMCVSARLEERLEAGQVYPAAGFPQVSTFRFKPSIVQSTKKHGMLIDPKALDKPPVPLTAKAIPNLLETEYDSEAVAFDDQSVANLGEYLLAKYQPDLFAIYFKSIDKIQHLNWEFRNWQALSADRQAERKRGQEIEQAYQYFDEVLNRYLTLVDDSTNIIILSDHGMEEAASLAEPFTIRDLNLDLILQSLGLQNLTATSTTDWTQTLAYQYQKKGYSYELELNLNLQDREPQGIVPCDEQASVLEQITATLRGLNTTNGLPLFSSVVSGGKTQADAVCIINPQVSINDTVVCRDQSVLVSSWLALVALPSGVHLKAPPGMFLCRGPLFKPNHKMWSADVFGILPTLLYVAGLDVAKDMSGWVIEGFFESRAMRRQQLRVIATYDIFFNTQESVFQEKPGDDEIKEELRQLGYIQ